ncbi:hypothetical protein BDV24DRAFT_146629 [Aspergillus arachidicola]|uniref:Uncharacterized protein n=1 Tax=Aspergillus arachidicola TaxID=656916 RepID=A0A5N6YSI9_9EURO|nr:hypothetical protein BDV24DRAFT_146629 [Aspergillus arachidicola]
MGSRRQRKQLCVRSIGTRKLSLLLLAAIFYFIMYHLPPPPKTKNKTNSDRKPPKYDIDTTPRFLHLYPFRENPDTKYERQVSKALNVKRESDSFEFEQKNGDWEYSLIDNIKAYKFITDIFSGVPELKKLYNSYPYHIIRSDLIRYLLLWYYGGFYADIDIYPAHPILLEVIVRALSHIRQHIMQSNFILGPQYKEDTILEITGPGVFTDTVLDIISQTLPPTHNMIELSIDADTGKSMGGICILPISVWGNGQRHSGSDPDRCCIIWFFKY